MIGQGLGPGGYLCEPRVKTLKRNVATSIARNENDNTPQLEETSIIGLEEGFRGELN